MDPTRYSSSWTFSVNTYFEVQASRCSLFEKKVTKGVRQVAHTQAIVLYVCRSNFIPMRLPSEHLFSNRVVSFDII